jgi:hypothetical protein
VADNGITYLARSGDNVLFRAATSPLESRYKWKITSADLTLYPNGTPIEYGKTPFLVQSTESTRKLKAKADANGTTFSVHNLLGSGPDSVWTLSWACVNGDTCY